MLITMLFTLNLSANQKEIESDVNRFEISYLISNNDLYIKINPNETINLLNVYEVLDNTTVNNKNINNNVIDYSIVPGIYFSSIIVRISYSYEDIRYYEIHSLYIYNENNSLYVSEIENYPYIKYLNDQLNNNFITNSEYEELVNSYYCSNIPFNIEQSEEEHTASEQVLENNSSYSFSAYIWGHYYDIETVVVFEFSIRYDLSLSTKYTFTFEYNTLTREVL